MRQIRLSCSKCENMSDVTDWKPSLGFDSRLRQFKCSLGHIFYKRLTAKKLNQLEGKEEPKYQ